jgi:hypothetical protein
MSAAANVTSGTVEFCVDTRSHIRFMPLLKAR